MATAGGEVTEGLIVIGRVQSPGVVILRPTEIILAPLVGNQHPVQLGNIRSIRSVRFFNGKTLLWKKWIVLSTSPRLGFAVPDAIARRWLHRLAKPPGKSG